MTAGAWICLASPLAAAVLITLLGTRLSRRGAGYLATLSVVVSFAGALVAFVSLLGRDGEERTHLATGWTWLGAGDFSVGFDLLVDPLSVFMMLVVSGVGSLIVGLTVNSTSVSPATIQLVSRNAADTGPGSLPDFTALVERYGPAVVNVAVVEKAQPVSNFSRGGMSPNDPFQEFFRRFGGGSVP